MTPGHRWAMGVGAVAVGVIGWAVAVPDASGPLMVIGAVLPLAVVLAVWGTIGGRFPIRAALGGAVVGAVVAIVSHAFVLGFAYAFLDGFAGSAVDTLDAIQVDPRLTEILGSPWTILLLAELVVVAPITEEFGKALGARAAKPVSRGDAFLIGAAAGAGFAVLENVLYASAAAWFGAPWTAVLLGRALGAGVHILASGLVVLGWWEWCQSRDGKALARYALAGVGVHATWNGSLAALTIADGAYRLTDTGAAFGAVSLAYSAALGAVIAAGLWRMTVTVDTKNGSAFGMGTDRGLTGWIVMGAGLLIPVAVLVLTFPAVF